MKGTITILYFFQVRGKSAPHQIRFRATAGEKNKHDLSKITCRSYNLHTINCIVKYALYVTVYVNQLLSIQFEV